MLQKRTMEELNRKSVEDFKESEKQKMVVILDNVRSMHNVGSIFRTSDAFLIEKIWLCGFTPRPPHRDIQKTALGATETVAWEYQQEIIDRLLTLKEEGYTLIAVEQAAGSMELPNWQADKNQKLAIIFGNEVEGVQDKVMDVCDAAIEIPQMGTKHSLNVSVAAGIVLYKLTERVFA